jgi:hypothetical protein
LLRETPKKSLTNKVTQQHLKRLRATVGAKRVRATIGKEIRRSSKSSTGGKLGGGKLGGGKLEGGKLGGGKLGGGKLEGTRTMKYVAQ